MSVRALIAGTVIAGAVLASIVAIALSPGQPTETASATQKPTASTSPSPTSTPAPAPVVVQGVKVDPLGDVRGEYVFATRDVPGDGPPTSELWAIPLSDGTRAQAVVRYRGHTMPWLAGKISPDGRRFAVPADRGDGVTRILIVSLIDGALAWLKTDDTKDSDTQPVWDPSGKQIAFVRAGAANQWSLWAVSADGSALRRITDPVALPMYLHTWTADGGAIAFYQGIGYDVISLANGARSHASDLISADASWRAASPALLATVSTSINFGSRYQVVLAAAPDGPRTVIAETAAPGLSLGGPRWRPGRDEFLYSFGDAATSTHELRVRSLSGAERRFAFDGGSPAWTTDGSAIVYLRGETAPFPGEGGSTQQALVLAEIRVIGADGGGDRTLYRTPAPAGALPPNWCVCNDALAVRKL